MIADANPSQGVAGRSALGYKGIMSNSRLSILTACVLVLAVSALHGHGADTKPKLNILKGPAKAHLGSIADIDVPSGYAFVDGASTRALMKASGEPVSGHELGLLKATNAHW